MTGGDQTGASSSHNSHSAAAASKPKRANRHGRQAANGHKEPLANTAPGHLASGSGGGGGVPTIAWILAALAVVGLGAGSTQMLRNRRDTQTAERT